ncbi:MAG: glycosyltransferase family 39 protein, partial [Oscillospiraceae bacterium]|nr:glycosyltransferase family 39 protein [Oscillospiraceae bacterium]
MGGAFAAAAPALAPFSGWGKAWLLPAGFLLGLAAAFFAPRLSSFTNERAALGLALGATLLTGAAWLLLSRVSPVMDFSRMFATAAAFAENRPLPDPAYQAVFPHLLGYPFVLSLLFRVSGPSVAAAQIFNLFLSLCIAALLFSVGKKLLGVGCGLAAGLLWALMPSHFMLLSLVAGEPLHIALTLLAVRVYLQAAGAPPDSFRGSLPYWGLLGLTVALSSLVRPLGPVYLLAFALCALVFGKRRLTRLALSLLVMLAVYAAVTQAGTVLWEKALERPVARNG